MSDKLNSYDIAGFTIQSYFDEDTTGELFLYAQSKKLIGRTKPPRRAFIGLVDRLLWEKRFTYKDRRYVMQGGGKVLSIFEDVPQSEQSDAEQGLTPCVICEIQHPDEDLVATEKGAVCRPCYEVWYPTCEKCGRRFALPEDADPELGPFLCDECEENEE